VNGPIPRDLHVCQIENDLLLEALNVEAKLHHDHQPCLLLPDLKDDLANSASMVTRPTHDHRSEPSHPLPPRRGLQLRGTKGKPRLYRLSQLVPSEDDRHCTTLRGSQRTGARAWSGLMPGIRPR
jgi:hypothetical protein